MNALLAWRMQPNCRRALSAADRSFVLNIYHTRHIEQGILPNRIRLAVTRTYACPPITPLSNTQGSCGSGLPASHRYAACLITSPADRRLEETSVISMSNDDQSAPLSITIANDSLYLCKSWVFIEPFSRGHVCRS